STTPPGGVLNITGTAGDDTIVITPTGVGTGTYTLNGGTPLAYTGTSVVLVDALGGSNSVTLNGSQLTAADNAVVSDDVLLTAAAGLRVNYTTTGNFAGGIVLKTGTGNDAIRVLATRAGSPTTVDAGAGDDSFVVASAPGTLDALASALTLEAGTGANLLYTTEAGRTAPDTLTLTASTIASAAAATLTYRATGGSFAAGFFLIAGAGGDTVFIQGTAAGSAPLVYTGPGDDAVYVTSAAGTLDLLAGDLVVDEGPGANSLNVSEAGRSS